MAAPDWSRELELVDEALAKGDVPHALTHLGGALALAPNQEQVHARVEAIASKYPLLELLPKNEFLGAGVLEAFALRRVGRVDEAVVLLAQLAKGFPAHRFETLLAAWLVTAKTAGLTLKSATLDQVVALLMMVGESTIGLHRLHAGERELLSGYEALADAAREMPVSEYTSWVTSGLYRRLGLFEKALAAVAGEKGYFSVIQRGLAQRASGDAAAALTSFQEAAQLKESTDSDTIEQVRCLFALGDSAAALALLKTVTASSLALDAELSALRTLCERPLSGDGVDSLDRLSRMIRGSLQQPGDATANVFAEHREKLPPGTARLKLEVSGWESPSNHLLVALFMSGTSELAQASYSLKDTVTFERDPMAQVLGAPPPTWRKRDAEVVHAASMPSASLRSQLGPIAVLTHAPRSKVPLVREFSEIWARAGALAAKLNPQPAEVMAAMVHPPTDPEWLEQLPEALYLYQVGVACVLAQLPRPWSELSGHFESLLFGPVDWTSAAAIVALAEKTRRDPEAARDGLELLSEVTKDLLPHTAEPRAHPLMIELSALPTVSGEVRRRLADWFAKQFPQKPEPAPVSAPVTPSEVAAPVAPSIPGWVWLGGTLAIIGALIALSR